MTEYLARLFFRTSSRGNSLSPAPARAVPAAHHASRAPRATQSPSTGAFPAVNRELVRFPRLPLPQSSCLPRSSWHMPAEHPRMTRSWPSPVTSTLQCGEFAENLQVPRRSSHKRGKVPTVVAVAAVTAGAAVVAAAAATAAVDANKTGPPRGDRWCRGLLPHSPPVPGSRFCRWRLARCGWHRGPHLHHVEVGLAV